MSKRILKKYDMFDIYIEPKRKVITVLQKWKYNWLDGNYGPWTYSQKKEFHDEADKVIWSQWSGKYFAVSVLKSIENDLNGSLIKTYDRNRFTINFDIQWVLTNAHWTVNVTKSNPGHFNSHVSHNNKEIHLSFLDIYDDISDPECNLMQNVLSHEFGHVIDNRDEYDTKYMSKDNLAYYAKFPNELSKRLKYYDDYSSRMNIGNELRDRFVQPLEDILNTMVHGVSFSAQLTPEYVESIGGRF